MSYLCQGSLFHYIVKGGLVFMTLTPADFPKPAAFQYLKELQRNFFSMFGDAWKSA